MKIFSIGSSRVVARVVNQPSPFDAAEVEASWIALKEKSPDKLLFNGNTFELVEKVITQDGVELLFRPAKFAELMFAMQARASRTFNFCSVSVCVHDTQRVLLAKMQARTVIGGTYAMPGGGLDERDNKDDVIDLKGAAYRELYEEVSGLEGHYFKEECTIILQGDDRVRMVYELQVLPEVLDGIAVADMEEVAEVRLMTFAEVAALEPKSCGTFIQAAVNFIGNKYT